MKWHVYIARGQWAASHVFEADTKEEAKVKAAALWTLSKIEDLAAHKASDCRNCDR